MSRITLNPSQSITIVRWYISLLTLSRGVLYTPIIVSIALFLIYIPRLIASDGIIQQFILPQPPYDALSIVSGQSSWITTIGIAVSYAEYLFRQQIKLSLRKKSLIIITVISLGYVVLALLLLKKTDTPSGLVAIFIIPLYILSLLSLLMNAVWWHLLRWCDNVLEKSSVQS